MSNLPYTEIKDDEFAAYVIEWTDFVLAAQKKARTATPQNPHMQYDFAGECRSMAATLSGVWIKAQAFLEKAEALSVFEFPGANMNAPEKEAIRAAMTGRQRRFALTIERAISDLNNRASLIQTALRAFNAAERGA